MYAEFININAFHQPGVQAYKLAAKDVLALRGKVLAALQGKSGFSGSGKEFAELAGTPDKAVEVASMITPVPGGVGPMTIAGLLRNACIAKELK